MLENVHIPLNVSSGANIDIQFGLEKGHKKNKSHLLQGQTQHKEQKKALNGVWAPLREISFY